MPQRDDTLLRAFSGVLLGFVGLASLSAIAALIIGAVFTLDQLCQPGQFAPSPLGWALTLIVPFCAALLGGTLCRTVAMHRRPVLVLAAIVGIMAFFQAAFASTVPNDHPPARTGQESAEDQSRQMLQQQPLLLKFAQPAMVVSGILLGGSRRRVKPVS